MEELFQYELQQKALQRLQETCSFHPTINPFPRHHGGDGDAMNDSITVQDDRVPVEERLMKKGKFSEVVRRERAELKRQMEEAERQRLFRPQVNPDDPYKQRLLHPPNLPVEERLLHYGRTVEESRQQLRKEKEAQEEKQLLKFFRPSSDTTTRKKQQTFLTRAETRQNDRDKQLGEKRVQLMKEYTFQPSIGRLSQEIDEQKQRMTRRAASADRAVLLHEEAKRRQQQRELKEREHAAMETDRKVYQPTTNPASLHWIERGAHGPLFEEANFVERQEEYMRVHEDHVHELREAHEQETQQALEASKRALHLRRVNKAMIDAQVRRLYDDQQEISAEVKQRLEERLLREACPFKPVTSIGTEHVMQRVHRDPNVVRRLTTITKAPPKRSMSADDSALLNSSTGSAQGASSKKKVVHPNEAEQFYRRQVAASERTKAQAYQKHSEKELEEHLQCTFRPKLNARRAVGQSTPPAKKQSSEGTLRKGPSSSSPNGAAGGGDHQATPLEQTVAGLGDFLKRREMAIALQKEKEARIQALGKGLPCNGPNYTVITPFHLSEKKPNERNTMEDTSPRSSTATPLPKQRVSLRSDPPPSQQYSYHYSRGGVLAEEVCDGEYEPPQQQLYRHRAAAGSVSAETTASSSRGPSRILHDDRVPRQGHYDPYNSERLLAAINKYNK